MESNKKAGFPQGAGVTQAYNSFWPPKCGGDSESLNLIKGKDFDDNVEAHESTCYTWPAGGAGAPERVHGDYGTDECEHERACRCAASGYDHYFGPSYDWQVASD